MSATSRAAASNAAPELVDALMRALAETSVAQMKAQNYHWNVEGMAFGTLHELFENIYKEHFAAVDELAERIKAVGGHADGRYGEFLSRSSVKESDGHQSDRAMVKDLADDQRRLSQTMHSLADVADRQGDIVTNDLAVERAAAHDKFAWMLSSHVKG